MSLPDLEDYVPDEARAVRRDVVPAVRVRKGRTDEQDVSSYSGPGSQSVWVRTWGCGHNSSDAEYMMGQLSAYGYTLVEDPAAADLWLLNSCTVKNPSEESLRNELERAKAQNKHVVVAGCVSQAAPNTYLGYSILGTHQIDRVVEVVEETLKGHSVRLLKEKKADGRKQGGASLALPKIRKNALIEIIPISTGCLAHIMPGHATSSCLNQCTYCKTKHARGELGSYVPEEIVDRVVQVLNEGVVEVWLTSEDTGAYGHDIGSSLPELLWKIVEVMREGTMLRVGMTNPPYILEYLEEMAKIFNHPRVYKFLHVPVQAGSDRVLEVMKREYTVADFRRVVDYLYAHVPGMTIATDVICGFPTETPEEFDETLALIKDYKFPVINISQFYPRPGTPAKRMPQVASHERKRRSRLLTEVFNSYEPYAGRASERYRLLVTETATDGKQWVGHNESYEQVLVPMRPEYLGKELEVQVVRTGKFYMVGAVVEGSLRAPGVTVHTRKSQHKSDACARWLSWQAAALFAVLVVMVRVLVRLYL